MYKKFVAMGVLYDQVENYDEVSLLMSGASCDIRNINDSVGKILHKMNYDRWQNQHTEEDVVDTLSDLIAELYKTFSEVTPIIHKMANLAERTQREFNFKNSKNAPSVRSWIEIEVRTAFHDLWFEDKQEEQQIINQYIDECVEGWTGTDDPMDSENDYLRNKIIDYLEIEAERINEMLNERDE